MQSMRHNTRPILNFLGKYDMTDNDVRRKFMFQLLIRCGQIFLILLGSYAINEGEILLGLFASGSARQQFFPCHAAHVYL